MPVVQDSFYEGRSVEQKREIAEIITDALVRVAGSKREAVNMLFDNHAREDLVIGGAPELGRSTRSDAGRTHDHRGCAAKRMNKVRIHAQTLK